MRYRSYNVGSSTITFYFGDITTSKADVVVSSDDYWLTMGGGVSAAIRKAAGPRVAEEAHRMVPARAGDVVVTSAGDLPAKYIFHAITIGPVDHAVTNEVIVRQATRRVMELLPILRCHSVAFPSIGAGVAGMSYKVVASQMATTLVNFLLGTSERFQVELYLLNRPDLTHQDSLSEFFEEFVRKTLGVIVGLDSDTLQSINPPPMPEPMDENASREQGRRAEIFRVLQYLDRQRTQVEAELLNALAVEGSPGIGMGEAKSRLEEVLGLRSIYERELDELEKKQLVPFEPGTVFLSSTYVDLIAHRKALRKVIEGLNLKFIGMEDFYPNEIAPPQFIRKKVREAEVYVAVLGMRYGSIDPNSGLSMTHLEYNQAAASGKPMRIFVLHEDAFVKVAHVEQDADNYDRLLRFRRQVLKERVCGLFRDESELTAGVEKVLKAPMESTH